MMEGKSCSESEAKTSLEEMMVAVERKREKLLPGQDSGAEGHSECKCARRKAGEREAFRGSEGLGLKFLISRQTGRGSHD